MAEFSINDEVNVRVSSTNSHEFLITNFTRAYGHCDLYYTKITNSRFFDECFNPVKHLNFYCSY